MGRVKDWLLDPEESEDNEEEYVPRKRRKFKDKEEKIEAFKDKLKDKRRKQIQRPSEKVEVKYDDVYVFGAAWLDSL